MTTRSEYNKEYWRKNKERLSRNASDRRKERIEKDGVNYYRKYNLKFSHGITPEEYAKLRDAQDNLCKICGCGVSGNLVVDHDEPSGKIRGLLCWQCNAGIGQFHHKVEWLIMAIIYLLDFKISLVGGNSEH